MTTQDLEYPEEWDLFSSSQFLTSKNAVDGEKANICSDPRLVPSKFNKDKHGEPVMDTLIDLIMQDGSVKTLRLNKASKTNLKKAGVSPKSCKDLDVTVRVFNILVRGEMAKSVVIEPGNPL